MKRDRLANVVLSACGLAVFTIGFFVVGPWAETKFFPVYSKFRIISIEPSGDDASTITFEFEKNRACEPKGMAWYFGEPGTTFRQLRIDVTASGIRNRALPVGKHTSREYLMDATPDEIRDATFAEIFNTCHPFWTTRSEIYP